MNQYYENLFEKYDKYFYSDVDIRKFLMKEMESYMREYLENYNYQPLPQNCYEGKRIVVSLTSLPKRYQYAWIPISCMFTQDVKPSKVVLYIDKSSDIEAMKNEPHLAKLLDKGFEIRLVEDVGPHTKYYYAMKDFPDDIVITIDDDIIYRDNLISKLMETFKENPGCVCAHWVWQMRFKCDKSAYDFLDFFIGKGISEFEPSHLLLPLGVGGVLYPPHLLPDETFDLDKIRELSFKADDVWLKGMEILGNVKVAKVPGLYQQDVEIDGSQQVSLNSINHTGGNNFYIKNVFDYYNLYDRIIELGEEIPLGSYRRTSKSKWQLIAEFEEKWIKRKQQGKTFADYMDKQEIKSVAIYGMGSLGRLLADELKLEGFTVRFGIDRNASKIECDIPVYTLEEIKSGLFDVDGVIISVVDGYETIRDGLPKELRSKVHLLEEMLFD